jgi:hypothetical protein
MTEKNLTIDSFLNRKNQPLGTIPERHKVIA